jgi:hypothetical protein
MSQVNLKVGVEPADAIEVLKAYDKSEWSWDLVSTPNAISNVITLQLRQDGNAENVKIVLLPDGRWQMQTTLAVHGDPE